ncbi:MAG TPA: bifunctional phosphoribosylaminoimidazolecarboxamide formyltransferase/IMP cyclohydrolase [Acidimicrobiia bacterium]|nr:bifunctional phosphoribosylaminoimidazolecarboxamide formyltransferase/IMP cyclohydrolase [Acidimicrobiia bacterium]
MTRTQKRTEISRALLSVYDKTGIVEFARALHERGVSLVSSGGTAKAIADAGIPVTAVDDITGVPPILDHRVVTLHPKIHGGILADRTKATHDADMATYGIEPFDLVVSNLYPFAQDPGVETIDIGGPAMVRAAAKNHAFVTVVTDASQYAPLLEEMDANDNTVGEDTRRAFAVAAFASTAAFDAQIVAWLQATGDEPDDLPTYIDLALERTGEALRYGENPHQHAARYRISGTSSWWDDVEQHAGLALSYLNLYDADAAWKLVHDLGTATSSGAAVAIIKHANPCGVALADDLATAYQRALECDERSAFGGIVALSRPVDAATAERMVAGPQADLVMAPGWAPGTIDALVGKRKNTRLLTAGPPEPQTLDFRQISGGFLVQDAHHFAATRDDWRVVTKRAPTDAEWRDAELAWRICGHVKSNAIVLVKDGQAVGIGAGQQNRVESGEIAAKKADGRARGGACASDAFYPFPDGIEAAAAAGVAVIVQPGGSMRDEPNIERADELGVAMVFTGERHFLH